MQASAPLEALQHKGAEESEEVGSYEQVEYVEEVVYEEVEEEVTDDAEEETAEAEPSQTDAPAQPNTTTSNAKSEPAEHQGTPPLPTSKSISTDAADDASPVAQSQPQALQPQAGDPEWKQIEEKAQLVAQEVKEVSKKLATGIFSAIGNVGEAGTSISRFAGGWSQHGRAPGQQRKAHLALASRRTAYMQHVAA